ncbi:TonB-dependent receptor [Gammaproteobacteria bacterium PRO2]|nr:TonB-dependent receptor [Gammaproteobacteria bacterium]MDL1880628.1 TonB-dependent receptor [Gammaproteobacteria bacterium PRO2]
MAAGFVSKGRGLLVAGCAAMVLGTGMGSAAVAQEPRAKSALDEIIVTTTKREETLQSVPISVGVVGGDQISEFSLKGLEDVQNYVPNLVIQETLGSYNIRIRGIGSGASQLSFVSAVGTFTDGVYCGRPRCFQNPLFDIDRIEVVRGPQGDLFGKNTIAGAVSTISKGPTREFEAEASAGVEFAEGGYNVSGIMSGPITDQLGFRLAAKREDLDGYVKNTVTGKDENAVESDLVRGILDWDPSDNLHLRLKAEFGNRDYDGYTQQLIAWGGNPGTAYYNGLTIGVPFSKVEKLDWKTSALVIWPDGQYDNTDNSNYSLQVDWDIGDFTLTSITGAVGFDFKRRTAATVATVLAIDSQISEDYEQYSQELRLLSPTGGVFDYVVGAYYSKDNSKIEQVGVYMPGAALYSYPANLDSLTFGATPRSYRGEGDSYSVYGRGTFHFMEDRLRTIFGLRLGKDTMDAHSWIDNSTYNRVTDTITPTAVPQLGANYQEFNLFGNREERYTLPSFIVQYDLTDEIMSYVSYAEGFKAGGFIANDQTVGANVLAQVAATTDGSGVSSWAMEFANMPTITPAQLQQGVWLKENNGVWDYKPEKAESWELGAKMKFLDGALSWNVALFHTEFKDMQSSQYDGIRFITRNAGQATSKGIETDIQWRATDNLTLGFNGGYVDATYDEYKNTFCKVIKEDGTLAVPGCTNGTGDLSGEPLERTPKVEGTLTADWDSQITSGLRLLINGAVSYSGDYFITQDMSPLYQQDKFTKVDLRLALADVDDRWEAAIVGRNITDQETINHAFQVGRAHAASVSTPRYVTLQGTWRFR